jgi:polyhydroxyalkanoate synthesis regulator phasin
MAARADGGSARDAIERLALAAVGVVALTAERVDELVDELADRGGLRREEARAIVDDVRRRWTSDARGFGTRLGVSFGSVARELGLVTRDEWDELELRVAQLEHRLRLLESDPRAGALPPGSGSGR